MKTRLTLLALIVLAGTIVAGQNPNIGSNGWYAWEIPTPPDVSVHDHGCSRGGSVLVVAHMENGSLTSVKLRDADCPLDAVGQNVQRIEVDPAASIAFLEKHRGHDVVAAIALHEHPNALPALERLAARNEPFKTREQAVFWIGQRGGDRGFRFLQNLVHSDESTSLRKKAVFSVSQSHSEGATAELIQLARNDESHEIRREALFWLGQRAGEKAAAELRRAVDEDPDDDVREHAVFAISQLPKERSVPMLIDLVRNHKSAAVRKKAMFWLTQSGDDRALEVIEEILTK